MSFKLAVPERNRDMMKDICREEKKKGKTRNIAQMEILI